jgi:hypothetical protein
MKPIIIFIYQETRAPKKGEWVYPSDGNCFVQIAVDRANVDIFDIYSRHEIQPPEGATKIEYQLLHDKQGYVFAGHIPLPQLEKRCRWRYMGEDGVHVETVEKFTEIEIKVKANHIRGLQPIEEPLCPK